MSRPLSLIWTSTATGRLESYKLLGDGGQHFILPLLAQCPATGWPTGAVAVLRWRLTTDLSVLTELREGCEAPCLWTAGTCVGSRGRGREEGDARCTARRKTGFDGDKRHPRGSLSSPIILSGVS